MRGREASTRPRKKPRGEVELAVVKMKSRATDHARESSKNKDRNIIEWHGHKSLKLSILLKLTNNSHHIDKQS